MDDVREDVLGVVLYSVHPSIYFYIQSFSPRLKNPIDTILRQMARFKQFPVTVPSLVTRHLKIPFSKMQLPEYSLSSDSSNL